MKHLRRVNLGNTELLILGQLGSGVISFIAVILVARYCGASVFGYCTILVSVLSVLLDLVDFGGANWASRELSASRISATRFWEISFAKSKLSLSYVLLIPLLIFLNEDIGVVAAILFTLFPFTWLRSNYIQQFLIVNQHVVKAVLLQLVERLCWLTIMLCAYLELDLYFSYIAPVVLGLGGHIVVGDAISRRRQFYRMTFRLFTFEDLRMHMIFRHFGISSVLTDASSLDSLIVARFASLTDSGNYVLANRIRNPLTMVPQAIASNLKPIAAKRDNKLLSKFTNENWKLFLMNSIGVLGFALVMLFYADNIFGSTFVGVNLILFVGSLTAIPSGIVVVLSAFLAFSGREVLISRMHLLLVPLNLSSAGLMAFYFGAIGSIFSILIIQLLSLVFLLFVALKGSQFI